jgi:hypothetical protein
MMIEGSGSIPMTSGSGSVSGRPKNMWIRWIRIRIRNTANFAYQSKGADRKRFDADSDPSFQFDAEPDLDPTLNEG